MSLPFAGARNKKTIIVSSLPKFQTRVHQITKHKYESGIYTHIHNIMSTCKYSTTANRFYFLPQSSK